MRILFYYAVSSMTGVFYERKKVEEEVSCLESTTILAGKIFVKLQGGSGKKCTLIFGCSYERHPFLIRLFLLNETCYPPGCT